MGRDHERRDSVTSTMTVATVDRFELRPGSERVAVLVFDDGQQLVVPAERLPSGCQEGSVIRLQATLDQSETDRRASRVRRLQSRLFYTGDSDPESNEGNR